MTQTAKASFKVENLKYCVGMGIALKEVIERHSFDYKCTIIFLFSIFKLTFSWLVHSYFPGVLLVPSFERRR